MVFKILLFVLLTFFAVVVTVLVIVRWMPGESFSGELGPMTERELVLEDALRRHVTKLAGDIGARSTEALDGLRRAERYIEETLREHGVERQPFVLESGVEVANFEVLVRGTRAPDESLVVGAHYDGVGRCPAANDNGSGTAAVLELARHFSRAPAERSLRFVLFVNEEPPYFETPEMGSAVYVRRLEETSDRIVGMFSVETIGYFSDQPESQKYPPVFELLYPDRGNFIGFVSNLRSGVFLRRSIAAFRRHARIPSEGASAPAFVPGVALSDHSAFWEAGYPAVMITDTAPFRYPHYHLSSDTPDKLDYDRFARVVAGLEAALRELAGSASGK